MGSPRLELSLENYYNIIIQDLTGAKRISYLLTIKIEITGANRKLNALCWRYIVNKKKIFKRKFGILHLPVYTFLQPVSIIWG